MIRRWPVAALPVLLIAGTHAASAEEEPRDQHLAALFHCRAIADATARLACFDREIASVEQAIDKKSLMVVDRGDVQQSQRSLFGVTIPRVRLFDTLGSPDLDHLDTVVTSSTVVSDGRLRFTVTDGAVWDQTDDYPVAGIRPGRKVTITHGALGTFFAKFEKGSSIRVKRLR